MCNNYSFIPHFLIFSHLIPYHFNAPSRKAVTSFDVVCPFHDGLVVDVSEKENVCEVFKNMDLDPHEQNLMWNTGVFG